MNPNREKELLDIVDAVISEGPYSPDWASLLDAPDPEWSIPERTFVSQSTTERSMPFV